MTPAFLKAILILPGTALVYVPALILWLSRGTGLAAEFPPHSTLVWTAGLALAAAGLALVVASMRLFLAVGDGGTPAPWQPIRTFVAAGPYRYVRNPMLSGVVLLQAAEAVLLQSWPLAGWALFFFLVNTLYFARVEEPELERRYGARYQRYKRHVGRWIPRLRPWRDPQAPGG